MRQLQAETAAVLKIADVRQHLANLGSEPVGDTPAEFRRFIEGEIDKWTTVARAAKVQLD